MKWQCRVNTVSDFAPVTHRRRLVAFTQVWVSHSRLRIPFESQQGVKWYGKTSGEYLVHGQGPSAEVVFSLPQPPGGTALSWLTAGTHTAAVQQARAGRLQAQEAEWMPQDVQKHSLKPCCTAASCWEATAGANLRQASEMERLFLQKRMGRPWD